MFQMRQIWLFCNVYSKEDGLQFGATIHRAKNMQYTTQVPHRSCSMQKKNLIKAPNIGEMRSFPKEQEVVIFTNFGKGLVRQKGQQSPMFIVELEKTCNIRITSWIMVLIAFLTNLRRS